jgi:hypothetical protein
MMSLHASAVDKDGGDGNPAEDEDDDDSGSKDEGRVSADWEEEEASTAWMASVSAEKRTGLVRCCSKPACMLLFTSSSMPYPDSAMPCGVCNRVNGRGRDANWM